LKLTVYEDNSAGCSVLPGARIEIWHCDAGGIYSDEAQNNSRGRKFLRGYQMTDDNGVVNFTTIYPGWYQGRAVHIHFKVRTYSGATKLDEFTSQFYLDDSLTTRCTRRRRTTRAGSAIRATATTAFSGTRRTRIA
jgi:protocatechuate 3,4-dioxygenase beta subunit